MSNWNTDFMIGDRVSVHIAQTTRDPRTHQIIVKHQIAAGKIDTIDLDGNDLGVRFDDGLVREVHSRAVCKINNG